MDNSKILAMLLNKKHLSSTGVISMVVHNNESIWEYVHHKYAPMMYGIILKMTDDKTIAEEVFKAVFLELNEKKVISKIHPGLYLQLLRHTYKSTLKLLKVRGQTPINTQPFNENYPLISQFCFASNTVKEVALKSGVTEEEMLLNLRAEFNQLRNLTIENV